MITRRKTKGVLHVKKLLGHKNTSNTQICSQLVNFQNDDYVCKAARTLAGASQLFKTGFEQITETENSQSLGKGNKLFRVLVFLCGVVV